MAGIDHVKRARRQRRGVYLSRIALLGVPYIVVGLMIWTQQEPAPTGETLRLLIQDAERIHALAVRGGDGDSQCMAARRLAQLYQQAHDPAPSQAWERTAKTACDRGMLKVMANR